MLITCPAIAEEIESGGTIHVGIEATVISICAIDAGLVDGDCNLAELICTDENDNDIECPTTE